MASPQQLPHDLRPMKANRKVAESWCHTCGRAFRFGEDVLGDPETGVYIHDQCVTGGGENPAMEVVHASAAESIPQGLVGEAAADPGSPAPAARVACDGEKYCTQCREIIRADAMKCRF